MKENIKKTIKHPLGNNRDTSLELEPTSLVAGPQVLPVTWKGKIDHHDIEVIQKGVFASPDNIEFKQFPKELGSLKNDIIKWMDEILRRYS